MRLLRYIPFLAFPALAYGAVAAMSGANTATLLAREIFSVSLASGDKVVVSGGALVVVVALFCFFAEIVRSAVPSKRALADNMLSAIVFIPCLVLFLLVQGFGTVEFFLVTLMMLLDFIADASLMGQHALAYVMITYLAGLLSRRILWFPLGQQAMHVAPLLLLAQAIQVAVRLVPGVDFPGLSYFIGPFIGAVLWLPLTFVLLLPQYQPIEHDANRPI